MHELFNTIPDPDVVLTLEPEELATTLLMLMRARGVSETFSLHNMVGEVLYEDPSRGISGCPRDRWPDLELAVSEAFAWMEAQALLVPQPGSHGGSWKVLSRRARRFESEQDLR
ncbi:hypothetical protein [Antarcticimicrobium sediminis]|uniref:Uncharacterized protein n=1 Tax=Antarcticimicrobium sediminis TaxID=2546227 RepID=A0A4R5EW23_9RHOB|nr:hypothetical protein [Antarcticimicrobium sediminis]TDE38937.1 hypothetical protein E1B25_07925 [Antarcticimicrobium sediminis]